MVGVFHLCLRQGGAAGNTPINWFFTSVNKTLFDDISKEAQLISFVFFFECEVRVIPVTKYAESFELSALMVNVFAGVSFTFASDFCRGGIFPAGFTKLLNHFEFDGQPVAVPTRHIRYIFTPHGLEFQDDILENFIERGPDMNVTIGKGWSVMEDKGFLSLRVPFAKA